ncbi:MAG: DNA repair protein RecN, partial [Gammaproteobacteria bacterium]
FCVTHQPQVAASAHQHFLVQKHTDQAQTFSRITPLQTPAEKIEELARMLGGLTITSQTRLHAQELLESLTA